MVMKSASQSLAQELPTLEQAQNESGFFSSESVLNILKLILDGSELSEVLAIIAQLVESQGNGTLCTIWLPDTDGKQVYCAAAPSLPGFPANAGRMSIGPKGASCGTAIYRREPVYVADILREPIWDDYRDRLMPYGIRAVWSRPLFTREGKVLGTFAIHYREVRNPDAIDLQMIENASHIAGIAIERHLHQEVLRHERDRLRLLLEITSSVTSRLDFREVVEALSTNLFRVMQCDVSA
jgi:formate hydrogenlyase transcriptional activator